MKKYLFFAVLSAIMILFLTNNYSYASEPVDVVKIGELNSSGEPVLTVAKSILISALEDGFNNGTRFEDVYLQRTGSDYIYLFAVGTDASSNAINIAIEAGTYDEGGGNPIIVYVFAASETHECQGNASCNCCLFRHGSSGDIVGCNCNTPECPEYSGNCTHKLTKPGADWWARAFGILGGIIGIIGLFL